MKLEDGLPHLKPHFLKDRARRADISEIFIKSISRKDRALLYLAGESSPASGCPKQELIYSTSTAVDCKIPGHGRWYRVPLK